MHRTIGRIGTGIVMAVIVTVAGAGFASESGAAGGVKVATVAPPPPGVQGPIAYGPQPYEVLDLQLPDAATQPGPWPVIIYVHSGGWIGGERTAVPEVATDQIERGYAVVSIDYQLAATGPEGQAEPSFPGAIWDVKRAIRFVKANAIPWNIDPSRVILMGASAGGYLAAFTGAAAEYFEPPEARPTSNPRKNSSVRGIVDFVGPTNLVTFQPTDHPWAAPLTASFLGCAVPSPADPLPCPDGILGTASVEAYVDASDPPIFLAYGADDELVVAATQGAPLARVWLDTHRGDPSSTLYDLVEGAGHTLPSDDTLGPLTAFFDRVAA